jgi:hypothetical protein
MASLLSSNDAGGNALHALGISDGGATKLLNDKTHGVSVKEGKRWRYPIMGNS